MSMSLTKIKHLFFVLKCNFNALLKSPWFADSKENLSDHDDMSNTLNADKILRINLQSRCVSVARSGKLAKIRQNVFWFDEIIYLCRKLYISKWL